MKQGWLYIPRDKKWHYFTDKDDMSLCKRWGVLLLPRLTKRVSNPKYDCKVCIKKLNAMKKKKWRARNE